MSDDYIRIALIPAYKPDKVLIGLLKELNCLGFIAVTVNDGSGEDYANIFDEARKYSAVLEHGMNLGKGSAIKTGLCYIQGNIREPYVVVTLDADGQHSVRDAVRIADEAVADPDALIIGSRSFVGSVPLRSRFGNSVTRAVFALTSGRKLTDTQTGLRAFSYRQTQRMLCIAGDRYEYEMNVLMNYAKAKTPITEMPIETVYIDGNASSHFRPVRDSYRIYKEILKFSLSSLISFGVDYVLFCILSLLTGQVAIANIGARVVSASVNFEINRRIVFKSKKSVKQSALGYFALALFILVCGTLLVTFLTEVVGMNAYIAKIITETSMFILSWTVQRTAIFADKEKGGLTKMKHRYLWAVGYGAALALFTGYVMLDTFVIPTVNVADASAINTEMFDNVEPEGNADEDVSGNTEETANTESTRPASARPRSTDKTESGSSDNLGSGTADESAKPEKPAFSTDSVKKPPYGDMAKTSSSSSESSESSQHKRPSFGKQRPSSESEKKSEANSSSASSKTLTTSENSDGKSYSNENISISISEYYENDTRIYVADVKLSSAQYLKTAFAKDSYGKNVTATTSETAEAKNAIFAVNGDYYGARESGYVIRNGVIYRSTGSADTDVLCIYADGHFEITNSSEKTTEQLLAEGVWQAFSFGPALVEDGVVTVGKNEEVGKAKVSNPRTAIGIIDDLHYIFVVADGRTSESAGLSLRQLAEFMQKLGVSTAYNLDGGGSSTMYFDGEVINNPTTSGKSINERKVSDIVYIG